MFTNANHPLGYKGPTTSPSWEKGTEAAFADLEYGAQNPKAHSNMMVQAVWVRQTGATPIAPGSFVKWSIPGTEIAAVAGANEVPCGVVDPYLTSSVAQNEYCWVIFRGPCDVLASTTIAVNAPITTAASGKAVTGDYTTEQAAAGRMIEEATAADQLRRALLDCRWW